MALGLPALVGVVAMALVCRRGVYLSPDGLAYVGAARNLVDGHGLTPPPGAPPLGNFPPLYPLLLATGGVFGADPLTVARFLNPALFGATLLVVGLMAHRMTGSVAVALAAQLLVLSGRDFLDYHSAALSEAPFLLVSLLALAALAAFVDRPRPARLVVAALLAATACLTRYVGLALVAAGALALVLLDGARRRWRPAIAFTGVAAVALAGWLAWVSGAAGQGTNRAAVLHPPGPEYFGRALETASSWVVPDSMPRAGRLVAAAAVAALLFGVLLTRRPARSEGPPRLAAVLGLFCVAYLLALVGDRLLFDATGRLDARFLLPLHAAAVLLGLWALRARDLHRSRPVVFAVGAVVAVQLAGGAAWVVDATTDADVRPGGFAAPRWTNSGIIDDVRALAPATPVYTNDVGALFFHTRRVARRIPEKEEQLTGRRNVAFDAQLQNIASKLRRGGVVVYFTALPARRESLPGPTELAARLGLEEVARDGVGRLYRLPDPEVVTSPAAARPR